MIRKILTTYAARLDGYLARSHRQPEGVAEVGLIGSAGGVTGRMTKTMSPPAIGAIVPIKIMEEPRR